MESTLMPPVGACERRRPAAPRYELWGCGLHGHRLAGTDAAEIRDQDAMVVREAADGTRWHRCLRCDAWLPLPPPGQSSRRFPPGRDEIEIPLRGKPLRDRYVLRLIALDRIAHFVLLGLLAVAVFAFANDRAALRGQFYRVVDAVQNGVGGVSGHSGHGLLGELAKAFTVRTSLLWAVGAVLLGYAVLEGVEAVGLWMARRWAEYLTLVATTLMLIPEIYELTGHLSATKILTLLINLAVVAYLLYAKRLFGLRGGGRAEAAERERDSGWEALERVLPGPVGVRAGGEG